MPPRVRARLSAVNVLFHSGMALRFAEETGTAGRMGQRDISLDTPGLAQHAFPNTVPNLRPGYRYPSRTRMVMDATRQPRKRSLHHTVHQFLSAISANAVSGHMACAGGLGESRAIYLGPC